MKILLFFVFCFAAYGQAPTWDQVRNKPSVLLFQIGDGAPTGNCVAGHVIYMDRLGPSLYFCSATNTWTIIKTGADITGGAVIFDSAVGLFDSATGLFDVH